MVSEKLIDRATAVQRVTPEQLDQLLHPTVDPKTKATVLATGLPASPGAAQGKVVFSPDEAEELFRDEDAKVILVRQETSPDDFHGINRQERTLRRIPPQRAGRRCGCRNSHSESNQPTEERTAKGLPGIRVDHRPARATLP